MAHIRFKVKLQAQYPTAPITIFYYVSQPVEGQNSPSISY
ncbi:hypothetical protein NSE_0093 [Neorickettsia sennetsu str. Miyayama]|uniref:Uncharacterized protein n=1 Tax=Ehrlichia sennetsu (strain ATCC VR-367 / Miyayama) TaxID=222891 RepID=Q2GEV2_EHRS3|nr:hypothetical protein NSE_0093 [Neorickettsia sennetsu str. Miyayama]